MTIITWLGGAVVSIVAFLVGKAYSQSEKVLDQKRLVYQQFLLQCPSPNETHFADFELSIELQRYIGVVSIYGSPDVAARTGEYFAKFDESSEVLREIDEPGHPAFLDLMRAYNDMVYAMRVDVMSWSFFCTQAHKVNCLVFCVRRKGK